MSSRLRTVLSLSTLCLGLAAMPANAGSTRVLPVSFACDGAQKKVLLSATGFSANSTQIIKGGGVTVSPTVSTSTLEYIRLSDSSSYHTIIVLGLNEYSAMFAMPTSFQEKASPSGGVLVEVLGACKGGGSVSGYATVYFN